MLQSRQETNELPERTKQDDGLRPTSIFGCGLVHFFFLGKNSALSLPQGTSLMAPPYSGIHPAHLDLGFTAVNPGSHKFSCCRDSGSFPEGTLPHRRHSPPGFKKCGPDREVPCNVGTELRLPEVRPRRRGGGVSAALMTVPEAAMHEDNCMELWQGDIRLANHPLCMKPVSEAPRVQGPTKCHFWLRVLSTDSRHHARTGLTVDDICHLPPGLGRWT